MYNKVLTERVLLTQVLKSFLNLYEHSPPIIARISHISSSASYYWIATSIFVVKYHSHKQFVITFPLWMSLLASYDNEMLTDSHVTDNHLK